MTIPAVGSITALTWALEVGEVGCFSSTKKVISYCGLCGAEKRFADTVQRTPLSKQRNKHLQTILIEAAKMAPRKSTALALLYHREKWKHNPNRPYISVCGPAARLRTRLLTISAKPPRICKSFDVTRASVRCTPKLYRWPAGELRQPPPARRSLSSAAPS